MFSFFYNHTFFIRTCNSSVCLAFLSCCGHFHCKSHCSTLTYLKCRTYLGLTDTSWNIILLSSSKTSQHPLLPGDGLPHGLIKKSLSCSDSSVPLACLCHLVLVYEVLFCFDRSAFPVYLFFFSPDTLGTHCWM